MQGYMDPRKRYLIEKVAVWCGPVFVATFAVFFGFYAKNIPHPHSYAKYNLTEIWQYYAQYQSDIRFGYIMCTIFIVLYFCFACALAARSWRVEGQYPVWTFIEICGGLMTCVAVSNACVNWITASYRLDILHVQVLNDVGWMTIDTQWACTTIQMFAIAFIGWGDKRPIEQRWIPNWLSWFSVIAGLTYIVDSFLPWVFDGPFTWSGYLSFNLTYGVWLVWILIVCYKLLGEINKYRDNPESMFETING